MPAERIRPEAFEEMKTGDGAAESGTEQPSESPRESEREAAREEAREGRSALLQKIFNKKAADVALNFTPVIDVGKLTAEAAIGKTMGGKELSSDERRTYVAVAGMVALAYALHFAGMDAGAVAARGLGAAVAGIEFTPGLARDIAGRTKEKFPSAAALLEKTSIFFEAGKPFVAEATRAISNYVRSDPDLILLDLRQNA